MISFERLQLMDMAIHQMSNSMQRLVIATGAVADANLRAVTTEAVREFSEAKDAYRRAKEDPASGEVFCAPAVDANGAEVA